MPREVYLKTVDTNMTGAFFAVQVAAKQMKARGRGGANIAVSSISALVGSGMQTHYTPSKAILHLADAVLRDRARTLQDPLQCGPAGHHRHGYQ
jgi:NAD(P)-dependent dehydrogenase (short-subunit alcohol dehydrogenase family)